VPLESDRLDKYHRELLAWFATFHRSFPWRSSRDPYAILIAEKLLQQTAATATVAQVYEDLLAAYPTVRHLGAASVEQLTELFCPLGLTYRAAELRKLAQQLVSQHDCQIPNTMKELLQLPGIGEYCARAVLSFAYDLDFAVIDTNVARLLHRLYALEGPLPANPARKRRLVVLADDLVPSGRSREYNFAVLDLCAQVCRPRGPRCSECPIREFCLFGSSTSG
jgi:A/G-specific adenine glycosylase